MLSKIADASPFGTEQYGIFAGNYQKVNNNVPTIQYFEDVFPYMKNYDYAGESATQAVFNNAWSPFRYVSGETLSLAFLDAFGIFPGCPFTGGANQSTFWADQFSSLYGLSHHRQQLLQRPAVHPAPSLIARAHARLQLHLLQVARPRVRNRTRRRLHQRRQWLRRLRHPEHLESQAQQGCLRFRYA